MPLRNGGPMSRPPDGPYPAMPTIPIAIYLHMAAAIAALVLGAVILGRRKGTATHRMLGRTWALTMLVVALTSLWVPAFLHFTWIHLFTAVTLVALPLGIWRIRRGNVVAHAATMKGLYIGGLIIAGVFTLVPGRLLGNLLWHGTWGYR